MSKFRCHMNNIGHGMYLYKIAVIHKCYVPNLKLTHCMIVKFLCSSHFFNPFLKS